MGPYPNRTVWDVRNQHGSHRHSHQHREGSPDRRSRASDARQGPGQAVHLAARAFARWPPRPAVRTGSSTGCSPSPACSCASAAAPVAARRRDPPTSVVRQHAPERPVTAETTGVRLDRDGPVATVTLCRPDVLNAQTPAMWARAARLRPGPARRRPGRGGPRRGAGLLRRPRPVGAPVPTVRARFAELAALPERGVRRPDRRLPGGVHLAAPARPDHASPPCRATPSAPASSSPSPATCGCSPRTPSSPWPR